MNYPVADMTNPLPVLRSLLLKREGDELIMVKVLGTVSNFGLGAVPVAMKVVLEFGTASAKHIETVFSRLK